MKRRSKTRLMKEKASAAEYESDRELMLSMFRLSRNQWLTLCNFAEPSGELEEMHHIELMDYLAIQNI